MMKIAFLNAFPNLSHSAEREFIQRCVRVLSKLGHNPIEVTTSDEILAFDPTFVVITHEFAAKTTPHYTVGLLWGPTQFYKDDTQRVKAIRSWDLVVPINAATRTFARDIHFPVRHLNSVSDLNFYPSSPTTELASPDPMTLSLAYVGAHWDGSRHEHLFRALADTVDLHVYGPPNAWAYLQDHYRGSLPFDGDAVIKTLNRHGVVLAVHKSAHVEEGTPSMRVFEACAAKCLIITDPLQPLVDIFGDSLNYIDARRSPRVVARQIADIMSKYRDNPALYIDAVDRVNGIFRTKISLERLLSLLIEDVAQRLQSSRIAEIVDVDCPVVTVIVRCGSRPLSMLQRAVASLASQSYNRIGIIFARFAEIDGFSAWLETLRRDDRFLFLTDLRTPGSGVRSSAMWAGLRAIETEFFCMLDDDDAVFPNHISSLVEVLQNNANISVTYSGVVRQEEDGIFLNEHVRFNGDLGVEIRERRELKFFDDFNLDRLLRFDNYIQSNAWLARRRVLTPDVLDDPELEVSEDMYFYLLLASRHQFLFSGTVSAVWNWRSLADDNSMTSVSQYRWETNGNRLLRRLSQVSFPGGIQGRDVLIHGLLGNRPGVAAEHLPATNRQHGKVEAEVRTGAAERDSKATHEFDFGYSIDFSAVRLPSFVVDAHGLAGWESWGRWTVGPKLVLKFRRPLPSAFALQIFGHAFESNHQKPIRVMVGRSESSFVMSSTTQGGKYRIDIDNEDRADFIAFHIPSPEAPAKLWPGLSDDTRKLGLALIRLDLIESDATGND
jgi:phosphoglycerol transferase